MILAVFPIRADTFLFSDLTDGVTLTASSRIIAGPCAASFGNVGQPIEECNGQVGPPSLSPFATITQVTILGQDRSFFNNIRVNYSEASPSETILSDTVRVTSEGATFEGDFQYLLAFESDINSSPVLCSVIGGCDTAETGGIQTVGTVTWSDGTVDTIQLQSDVNEVPAVPEPSSMFLLISVLAFLSVSIHRVRRTAN
jgi:hypothetical protein